MKKRAALIFAIFLCQMIIGGCQSVEHNEMRKESDDMLPPYMVLYDGHYYYYQGFQRIDDINAYTSVGKMASSVDEDCIPQQSLETNCALLLGHDVYVLEDDLFVICDRRKYKFSKDDNYDINAIHWDLQPSVSYEGKNYYFQGIYENDDNPAQKVGEITSVVPGYMKPIANFETSMEFLFECEVFWGDGNIFVICNDKRYRFALKE